MPRRELHFESLEDVGPCARALLDGYEVVGAWNLNQVASHLEQWMRFPMEGFPKPPLPIALMLGLVRVTVGKRMLAKVLEEGFVPGRPTMPQTVVEADAAADADAVSALEATAARLARFDGPLFASPMFGAMNRETAVQLQLRHCEHHLSFLLPRPSAADAE